MGFGRWGLYFSMGLSFYFVEVGLGRVVIIMMWRIRRLEISLLN